MGPQTEEEKGAGGKIIFAHKTMRTLRDTGLERYGLCAIRASNDMDFARCRPQTLRPLHGTSHAQFEPRAKKAGFRTKPEPRSDKPWEGAFWHPCAIARTAA